ncbi:GntR family transcriptional regulator [Mycolicibacterium austroafricanum]|jgi:DNA-binding GntR family transcriptional regulator|uniref:GntR family transcriptional regulator n=1 Tax=Mycolicibacterium austroafricanum TaxID=39687 RepID=A0ABT8H750_MYCAO|nr:GntR family transcriptional regulator [Mycolicibacterium austroafricanum]MDN4516586.1 GntR family transcriptional regulator [Mycolicibacterium austroafricanum]QRZ05040.1 GntR family transcriptional regulator [Mycolicibacterium austroafricanum]QZT68713.1 GntR family transcriptional regulator [Mycolicibacterium austroafricanum]
MPPAYQVLRERLRDDIAAGRYPDGTRLPTESELVARHGLSRQTVRRAFQDLVAEGTVYRVPGRGSYASEQGRRYLRQLGSIEDLMSLSDDTTMEVVDGLRRRVDIEAASRLRLDGDVVYSVQFRRLHGGITFGHTTVALPPAVATSVLTSPHLVTGATSTHTVIGLLEPHLEKPIAEAAQSITVAAADEAAAAAVACPPGHPMLRVDRLYADDEGHPVELAVSQFLPEQYTYRVTLRRSS